MFIVVQPTGFVPYFLAAWADGTPNWLTQRAYAKRFTRHEARRIVNQINSQCPVIPAHIEFIKELP